MSRLFVVVEGDTEQEFVKLCLAPHLTPPEDVNDGADTAPSKRLLTRVSGYNKKTHGPRVVEKVGIEELKRRCPRFGAWVSSLEALGEATP